MHRFAHAAVFAAAISAPVLAGALMDHSLVSVLGEPTGGTGPCSSSCTVGGANSGFGAGNGTTSSDGQAQGGHNVLPSIGVTRSGTGLNGIVVGTGRYTNPDGSISGNFTASTFGFTPGSVKGHCTGGLSNLCQ